MAQYTTGNSMLILLVLVFVAVAMLLESIYLLWRSYKGPQAQKLQKRLQALSAAHDRSGQTRLLKQRMLSELPALDRFLLHLRKAQGLDRFILQAGLDWTVSKLLLACCVLGAAGWLIVTSLAHQGAVLGMIAAFTFAAAPLLFLQRQRTRRLVKIEQQLPDALDLITRALRAGHAFSPALKMVGEELAEPLAGEFRVVHDEVNFGVSLQQALTNMSERVPIPDLRYFVIAVLIQRESGGNLTEILVSLSRLIRDRLKLLAKVRVLSAEGRLSAWILGLMPFALAGVMNLLNPTFMSPLWKDPIGIAIVKYMLILMVLGVLILRKIIRIRV